ncbi:YceI family protein [Helicobacter ailurogastricus]|uniref:YceI family protein n=1 Tax=Helicobacter ailurogastricus TaxID=1578720 RepID=UPI00244D8AF2|nr:YceI family protein [Helicobacter ailurogastricus]GMB89752.1 YceI family protein [Helicobacter ailurogastricus]
MRFFSFSLILAGLLSATPYSIDTAHSSVNFTATHLMVSKVNGDFSQFKGVVDIEKGQLKALDGEIEIKSIDTKNAKRDKDLLSANFFDAHEYPKGYLKATKISQKGDGGLQVKAMLKLKDTEKEITLNGKLTGPIKHPMSGAEVYGLELHGQVSRKAFKIGQSFPAKIVGEDIQIAIHLELHH